MAIRAARLTAVGDVTAFGVLVRFLIGPTKSETIESLDEDLPKAKLVACLSYTSGSIRETGNL